ncbi:HalOD1 output domain-containing protein [Halobaculum lipolyticum]|uniref:HalOD1 output domain-containing protein n=1 Tax=Halobaculum lipolyticum TaxID=3032001 RepID=A0ABD5WH29_9EURY|nr:HalOD1 output domain-containing protein [Halobaculum sp. DT31]
MRTGDIPTEPIAARTAATTTDSPSLYTTFDTDAREIAVDVARAVADASGRDPASMEPLANAVDPDALDALVGAGRSPPSAWAEVTFEYLEYEVTVCSDGVVTLAPRTD